MLQAISAPANGAYWTIRIPCNFTEHPPIYPIGLFVPLPDGFQPTPDVIYFGRISGFYLERWSDAPDEWMYLLDLPNEHPQGDMECWEALHVTEDWIEERLRDL